mmetsp:Transcript_110380/g.276345  ORF Transcript_110380/g.276345 Transcript_110380/m.276345 type:complete len:226 (-) Transcript_110380:652-1329(-)
MKSSICGSNWKPRYCATRRNFGKVIKPSLFQSKMTQALRCSSTVSGGSSHVPAFIMTRNQVRANEMSLSSSDWKRNRDNRGKWSDGYLSFGIGSFNCGNMFLLIKLNLEDWKNKQSIRTCRDVVTEVARVGTSCASHMKGCTRLDVMAASASDMPRNLAKLVALRSPHIKTAVSQPEGSSALCLAAKSESKRKTCATCLVRSRSCRTSSGFRARCTEITMMRLPG